MASLMRWLFGGESKPVRAKYDAAQTDNLNRRHWANADALAAVSAMTPEVRRTLRIRSRYEHQNNCYARGIVSTLVSDIVGTGPRLQVLTPDEKANSLVETRFKHWYELTNMPFKLRLLETARRVDGEGFGVAIVNDSLRGRCPVLLDLKPFEADQVAEPWGTPLQRPDGDDGIRIGPAGDPLEYSILKVHPGDNRPMSGRFESDWIGARNVFHWFRADRPGQLRGVPELTAALPLFAILRPFTMATLTAGDAAANFAAVIASDLQPGEVPAEGTPWETMEIVRGMISTLPMGWKLSQFDAKHPTTQFQAFVDAVLREIGRSLDVPFGITAGDSSRYNFSSAKLEYQNYNLRRDCERQQFDLIVMSKLFRLWLEEAAKVDGDYLPQGLGPLDEIPHTWHHDERQTADPQKDASADRDRLQTLTTSLAEIYAAKGMDWRKGVQQIALERAELAALGLTISDVVPIPMPQTQPATEVPDAAGQTATAA